MDQGAGAVPGHPDVGAGREQGWVKPGQDHESHCVGLFGAIQARAGMLHKGLRALICQLCQQSRVRPVPSLGQWKGTLLPQ